MRMAPPRKKPGRKPMGDKPISRMQDRHLKPRKAFHADQWLFDALEAYRLSLSPRPSESAILIAALEEFLSSRGFGKPPKKPS